MRKTEKRQERKLTDTYTNYKMAEIGITEGGGIFSPFPPNDAEVRAEEAIEYLANGELANDTW